MLTIGPYSSTSRVIVAPMAGVTDKPFRDLCRRLGSFWSVSEMVTSNQQLWETSKSRHRLDHTGEKGLSWVQLAGSDPRQIAEAAAINVGLGAQIIDINMGCPAKKICNVMAGSALLKEEKLVKKILESVVSAVDIPVTLKIRTGWDKDNRNAVTIAKIAEDAGIQALTMHGRTRACLYMGDAEYDTIASVKEKIKIPLIANGDITTPEKAKFVLKYTGADAVMIGRAAQGRPWIFREIEHYLKTGTYLTRPTNDEIHETTIEHVKDLYEFYGDNKGLRIARKHISWYTKGLKNSAYFRAAMNQIEDNNEQMDYIHLFFEDLSKKNKYIAYEDNTNDKELVVR